MTALCLALWLPGFFILPPGDRDESRFAQASKQMNESGDYVRIMNGAVPRNRKPIGIYWLQAPAAAVAGSGLANPIWPYRIPSMVGGLAAVLATYAAGRRLTADPRAAFCAGAMLASCVILTTETHIAKTDAALLGATTVAMAILGRAWMGAALQRWQAAVFWLAMGAGILIKGPVTPMVAGLAALTLGVWERRARWLRALRPAWGVPLMLALVAPWFVAIGVATKGAFFAQAVGGDLGGKLSGGSESHGGFFGEHLLLLPLLTFPSSLPVIAALPAAWARRRRPDTQFVIAWALPAWLVFEAVPTKLPHYTLPLYPALFLLAASCLADTQPVWARRLGKAGLVVAGALLSLAALALPVLLKQPVWIGVPAACAATCVMFLAWQRRQVAAWGACIVLYAAILQFELPNLTPLWIGPRVELALRQVWPAWNEKGDGLAVAGYAEPSLVFLTGTDTQLLPDGAAAAAALAGKLATLAVVADREMAAFSKAAAGVGISPKQVGEVRGFNYSNGRWVSLALMVR